jgi:Peptidase family M1 domain
MFALSATGARADTPPGLLATIEQFDRLTVGNAVTVGSMTAATGHLVCRISSGRVAPVLAGDATVGFFFEGRAEMEYLSVDPIEAPLVTFNAKKASGLKPEKTEKGVRLRDRFTRLLWIAQGEPLPAFTGADAAPMTSSLAAQREKFRRLRGAPLSYDFAIQRLDAPAKVLVRVEMDGGEEDLVYERSELEEPRETLVLLRDSESDDPEMRKFVFSVVLSDQPVGKDRRDPPPPRVLLSDVDLDLRASAGKDASMTVVETLVPIGRPLAVLRLNLDSIIYTYLGRNLTKRSERLRKVTDDMGRSLPFAHGYDQALIQLAEPAAAERPIRLKFEIDGDFLVAPSGHSFWELGIGDWLPQPPSLAGQLYTFHAIVRVAKPFVPFAPGKTIRREVDGDANLLETRVDKPICFAVVLAGDYTIQEEVKHGVTIRVATYALDNPRAVKQLASLAGTIIQYYQEFLGPFPLPEFNIIEINDLGWGQAPPGTMFITKEAFNPIMTAELEESGSRGFNEVFAHEIAHQYWGTAVKMPNLEEQWLTESFAEYCAALFLKTYKSEATYKAMVQHWRGRANFAGGDIPIPLANHAYVSSDAASRYFIRNGLLYNKGPALLYALHKELGDEVFFTFLKSYQKSFAWKFGSTKMVAGLLQYMTKKDYMPFFEKYYWGTEMPKN